MSIQGTPQAESSGFRSFQAGIHPSFDNSVEAGGSPGLPLLFSYVHTRLFPALSTIDIGPPERPDIKAFMFYSMLPAQGGQELPGRQVGRIDLRGYP